MNPGWSHSWRLSDFPVCADTRPTLKNQPRLERMPFAEMMLRPEKLEAVLKRAAANNGVGA
jgi:hypothetical protein